MTSIAYRDSILAADTQVSFGDMRLPERVKKVHRLPDGALFAGSGTYSFIEQLRLAIVKQHPMPETKKVDALMVRPDGTVHVYENCMWTKASPAPYYAIGSGAPYALAAMWCGLGAKKAIECAMAHDVHTGGEVVSVRLRRVN